MAEDSSLRTISTLGLVWNPPVENGGSPILDYQIDLAEEDGQFTVLASSMINSLTVVSLVTGTTYSFRVRARNAFGYGPDSVTLSLLCADRPGAPTEP